MSPSNNNPLFDGQDLQIQQMLNEMPVPQSAKDRTRRRLEIAAQSMVAQSMTAETTQESSTFHVPSQCLETAAVSSQINALPSLPLVDESILPIDLAVNHGQDRSQRSNAFGWMKRNTKLVSCLAVAVSLVLAVGVYVISRPIDRAQLVATCSDFVELKLESEIAWTSVNPDEFPVWMQSTGLSRMPQSVRKSSLSAVPAGSGGQLWKLTFDRGDLYVLEIHGASAIEGVGNRVQMLQSLSNSWSIGAQQDEQILLVFMTKGKLDQLLQISPLA